MKRKLEEVLISVVSTDIQFEVLLLLSHSEQGQKDQIFLLPKWTLSSGSLTADLKGSKAVN